MNRNGVLSQKLKSKTGYFTEPRVERRVTVRKPDRNAEFRRAARVGSQNHSSPVELTSNNPT